MAEKNVIDLITERVVEQVSATFAGAVAQLEAAGADARARLDDTLQRIEVEGREKLDTLFDLGGLPMGGPVITEDGDFDPVGWIKAQAKSRALRTLVQGGLAAVVIAFVTAVVQQVVDPNFDFTQFSDWKIAIGLGLGAVGTAASSYLQNKLAIKPPKVQ